MSNLDCNQFLVILINCQSFLAIYYNVFSSVLVIFLTKGHLVIEYEINVKSPRNMSQFKHLKPVIGLFLATPVKFRSGCRVRTDYL